MIESKDLPMVIDMMPRLLALKDMMEAELDYQLRLKGKTPLPVRDGEEEESKQRFIKIEVIRKSFSDKERKWLLTHKEDVQAIMDSDTEKKKMKVNQ